MVEDRPGTKIAEQMMTRPDVATVDEIVAATGGPQYNVLRRLEGRGYRIRKVKEGRATRFLSSSPAAISCSKIGTPCARPFGLLWTETSILPMP